MEMFNVRSFIILQYNMIYTMLGYTSILVLTKLK